MRLCLDEHNSIKHIASSCLQHSYEKPVPNLVFALLLISLFLNSLARIAKVLMSSIMAKRQKATVLYATETGKSEGFAKTLANLLSRAFDVKTFCMNEYDFNKIYKENLLIVVTSTFGNGEAPMNGEVSLLASFYSMWLNYCI